MVPSVDDKVVKLGSHAFKKYGAECLTLYQLAQAEEEGLWAADTLQEQAGVVLEFKRDAKETQ